MDELVNELEIREILAFTATLTERRNMITIRKINRRKATISVNGCKTTIKKIRPARGVSRKQITQKVYQSVAPVSRF
jgi:hypothetical protein